MLATMTSKGQIARPKPIRDQLGLHDGARLDFEVVDGALHARPVTVSALDKVVGILHRPGLPALSVEEMDQAIAKAVTTKFAAARGRRRKA